MPVSSSFRLFPLWFLLFLFLRQFRTLNFVLFPHKTLTQACQLLDISSHPSFSLFPRFQFLPFERVVYGEVIYPSLLVVRSSKVSAVFFLSDSYWSPSFRNWDLLPHSWILLPYPVSAPLLGPPSGCSQKSCLEFFTLHFLKTLSWYFFFF